MKRLPDMAVQKFRILSILMMLMAVAQSSTILRPSKGAPSGNEERGHGSNSFPDSPYFGEPDLGINRLDGPSLPEYDNTANEMDDSIPEGKRDSHLPDSSHDEPPNYDYGEDGKDVHGNVDDDHGIDVMDEGGIDETFGGEDDLKEPVGGKDYPEEPVLGEEDEVVDEHQIDEEDYETGEGVDDGKGNIPAFGGGGFFGGGETGPGFFGGGSIFDNPFFNLEQVRRYFHQMERALEHVFSKTVDEALLLNGTYANTTEEEVDIDGKKYTVLKSILKGRDNHTSIYVETLSSKPKEEGGEETNSTKV